MSSIKLTADGKRLLSCPVVLFLFIHLSLFIYLCLLIYSFIYLDLFICLSLFIHLSIYLYPYIYPYLFIYVFIFIYSFFLALFYSCLTRVYLRCNTTFGHIPSSGQMDEALAMILKANDAITELFLSSPQYRTLITCAEIGSPVVRSILHVIYFSFFFSQSNVKHVKSNQIKSNDEKNQMSDL